ncbi:MAG: response regulator transcription factor [Rhodobacteraceae bacterium]|nr:response regulator transcription factor [Paracoccaceae bacterium]
MAGKVLLIEDEPHIVEAISFLLERAGWQVFTHSNGQDAAEVAGRIAPDVIILDNMLPNKSGIDVLREIRADATTSGKPVLMLTAKGQARDKAAAEEAGVSMFMTKPFSNQAIIDTVKMLAQ